MKSLRGPDRRHTWLLALGFLGSCGLAGPARGGPCSSTIVDEVSVHAVDGHPVVTVSVDGEPVTMLLDTGAETSAVTPALAARLGLRVERGGPDTTTGVDGGGPQPVPVTEATVGLTGRGVHRRLLVLDMPGATGAVAGLAGVDLLSSYDVDLDEDRGRLTLRRPTPSCPADGRPAWAGPGAVRVPAEFTPRGRIILTVQFGAVTVPALLDTGVSGAVLSRGAAGRAGLTKAEWKAAVPATVFGLGLRPVIVRSARLHDLTVGGAWVGELTADIAEDGPPGVDMLLGNDFLARRRVLVSWSRGAVWVEPG